MTQKELEKIYNEGYRAVYWTALALLKNEADAEDVVQDTFVSFIESYGNIEDTTKVVALLKKIAANKSLNRLKSVRTENVDDEVLENLETVPEDFLPDSIVESDAMRRIVMDIIENSLSEDVRRTIILFYFDEMSTKEISDLLGVPQGTVLWRLNFARKKIKKEVEKYEEESNTKLFGMPLPFLTKLFAKEAEQVTIKPMPASLLHLSASSSIKAASAEAGKKIASEAVRKGTGIMIKKVIIALVAVLIVAGGITAILITTNQKDKKKDKTLKTETTETTEKEPEKDTKESTEAITESTSEKVTEEPTSETEEPASSSEPEKSTDESFYSKAGQSNESGTVFVSFDGKTPEEIKANLLEIFRTPMDTTLENLPERFTVYPNEREFKEDAVDWVIYFWDTDSLGFTEGIYQSSAHIVRNDDGTLDTGSRISVSFVVKDRDRWEELYTASCEALMEMEGIDSLMTTGSGDNESSLHMTYFVSKKTDGDGNLLIMVEMPLRDPVEEQSEA
ncbi:MAG: sigma-70 family RNA polymerase sigma factor [Clostridiales bacterium]|nr:sigma-70 family RNA polymerase sigma factor [Clostridiales bacterium]